MEVLMTVGSWEEPGSGSLSSPGLGAGVAPAQGAAIGDSKALLCSVGAVAPVAARWADAQAVECEAPAHAPGGAAVGLGVSAQLRVRGTVFDFIDVAFPDGVPAADVGEKAALAAGDASAAASVDVAEKAFAVGAVPRVSGLEPSSGSEAGGSVVQLLGEGLHSGVLCSFGTVTGVASRWASGSGVECVTPAHALGAVNLEVEVEAEVALEESDAGGEVDGGAGGAAVRVRSRDGERFAYVPEARVESVQPASGPTRGGTEVHVFGDDFNLVGDLSFWVSGGPLQVHVSTPQVAQSSMPSARPGFAGLTMGGTSNGPTEEAAVFLYREPAQVRGAFPRAAWHGGGALVHVSGQALVGSEAACRAVGPGAAPLASHRVSSALVVCETGAEEPGSMEVLMTV